MAALADFLSHIFPSTLFSVQITIVDASAHAIGKNSNEGSTKRSAVSHPAYAVRDPQVHSSGGKCVLLAYATLLTRRLQLSQRDQLSIAKTCVHLWELPYPMVYNHVVICVHPATEDNVWRKLASGVGLRYARHLEVHTSIQSAAYGRTTRDTAKACPNKPAWHEWIQRYQHRRPPSSTFIASQYS